MARTYRSRHLRVMRDLEGEMGRLFVELAASTSRMLMRHADAEGEIPQDELYNIQQEIDDEIMRTFLSPRGGQMVPFRVDDGQVQPISPYMNVLWTAIEWATRIPIEHHASILRRNLPQDVILYLDLASEPPVRSMVREQIFSPSPLMEYEPPHLWVDPNGYQLSDRIWRTASSTRRKIDAFLEEGVREGRAARDMASDLEQFLQPGRQLTRTKAPYGTDASYDAMRLARTEISRAAAQADEMSATMNPFVEGLKWNLSPQHPCCDICDDLAAGGPYPVDDAPTMPAHPHCMCYWSYELADDKDEIIQALREDARSARRDFVDKVGPLQVERFTRMLLRGWQVARGEAVA